MADHVVRPLPLLEAWIQEARDLGLAHPASVTFATAGADGRPSARTVTLKRVEADALVFTSALWTRKVRDLEANPHLALLFHWPSLGRQVHVTATAEPASDALADELFAERDPLNRWQAIVSRQGEPIHDLQPLRERLKDLTTDEKALPSRPPDWGALRVIPTAMEFWTEAPDRLHERRLFTRSGEDWSETLLSP